MWKIFSVPCGSALYKFHCMTVRRYNFQFSEERWNPRLLINRKQLKRNRVLTEEKLDDIGSRLENSPRKSLRPLVLQSGISLCIRESYQQLRGLSVIVIGCHT
jgi:hypothetical protein